MKKNIKSLEFEWNKLSRQDYLYFTHCRIISHVDNLIDSYPEYNVIWPVLKKNGDINAIIVKDNYNKRKHVIDIRSGLWYIFRELQKTVCSDLFFGNIGEFVYIITESNGRYIFFKVPIEQYKKRNKLFKKLELYREGGIKTNANETFNKYLIYSSDIDPIIKYEFSPIKKQKMFQNKQLFFKNEQKT